MRWRATAYVALGCACFAFQVYAQTCVAPPPGAIAWWPFDETTGSTAKDVVGGHDGVYVNNPVSTAGRVGAARRFNGVNQYVGAADSDDWAFGSTDFTIEFWANWDAPGSGDLVHAGDVFISSDEGPGGQNKWFFALGGGSLHFTVYNTAQPPANVYLVQAPFSPVVGQWYHLAVTKRGTLFTIYVNGVLQRAEVSESPIANANAPLTIGQSNEPFGGFMNGFLDEVTVYNRALGEGELLAIAQAASGGKCKALSISTGKLSTIQKGTFSTQQLEARFGSAPLNWSIVTGSLPSGMTLSPGGILSGTPTVAGSFPLRINVTDSEHHFSHQDFALDVLLVSPLPNISVHKSGTVVVPGRVVDYFIAVHNEGRATASNLELIELLDPPHLFTLTSTTPPAQIADGSVVYWGIPSLKPNEGTILSYSVRLDPTIPLGSVVSGQACTAEAGGSPEHVIESIPKCNPRPECAALFSILFDENAGELALCHRAMEICKECENLCAKAGPFKVCPPYVYDACLAKCGEKATQCAQAMRQCQPDCGPVKCPTATAQSVLSADQSKCFVCPQGCSCDDRPATGPVDPNEKLAVADRYIQPDQLLIYPIHYENIGTVEARDIFITDVLDANLDASTLQLLTPGASYDVSTRTVKWNLYGRNLPPRGTDNVLLSIKPKPNLPSGTAIKNKAAIQFEVFQPLNTNETMHIIDAIRPMCYVSALPAQTNTPQFTVSWAGSDAVGKIDNYTILYSVDGGTFAPLLQRTKATSTIFTGTVGQTYGFLCVAKDTAGNIEVQSDVAEATTRVIGAPACATNVTSQVAITRSGFRLNASTQRFVQAATLRNTSASAIQGPVSFVLDGLSANASLFNKTGITACESPSGSSYVNVNIGPDNLLNPSETATVILEFRNPTNVGITYATRVLAGNGNR